MQPIQDWLQALLREIEEVANKPQIEFNDVVRCYEHTCSLMSKAGDLYDHVDLLARCCLKFIDCISFLKSDRYDSLKNFIEVIVDASAIVSNIDIYFLNIAVPIFERITGPNQSLWFCKELLKNFNFVAQNTTKGVRYRLIDTTVLYLCKLADLICSCGDFDYQITLLETIFRMSSDSHLHKFAHDMFPMSLELANNLCGINKDMFDRDARKFLNLVNSQQNRVLSLKCAKAKLGNTFLAAPKDSDAEASCLWVDFNLGSQTVTIVCDRPSLKDEEDTECDDSYEMITVDSKDVNEVITSSYFHLDSSYSVADVIFFKLNTACSVKYTSSLEAARSGELKLAISDCAELETLTKTVLPAWFGDKLKNLSPRKYSITQDKNQPRGHVANKSYVLPNKDKEPIKPRMLVGVGNNDVQKLSLVKSSIGLSDINTEQEVSVPTPRTTNSEEHNSRPPSRTSTVSDALSLVNKLKNYKTGTVSKICKRARVSKSPKIRDIDELKAKSDDPKYNKLRSESKSNNIKIKWNFPKKVSVATQPPKQNIQLENQMSKVNKSVVRSFLSGVRVNDDEFDIDKKQHRSARSQPNSTLINETSKVHKSVGNTFLTGVEENDDDFEVDKKPNKPRKSQQNSQLRNKLSTVNKSVAKRFLTGAEENDDDFKVDNKLQNKSKSQQGSQQNELANEHLKTSENSSSKSRPKKVRKFQKSIESDLNQAPKSQVKTDESNDIIESSQQTTSVNSSQLNQITLSNLSSKHKRRQSKAKQNKKFSHSIKTAQCDTTENDVSLVKKNENDFSSINTSELQNNEKIFDSTEKVLLNSELNVNLSELPLHTQEMLKNGDIATSSNCEIESNRENMVNINKEHYQTENITDCRDSREDNHSGNILDTHKEFNTSSNLKIIPDCKNNEEDNHSGNVLDTSKEKLVEIPKETSSNPTPNNCNLNTSSQDLTSHLEVAFKSPFEDNKDKFCAKSNLENEGHMYDDVSPTFARNISNYEKSNNNKENETENMFDVLLKEYKSSMTLHLCTPHTEFIACPDANIDKKDTNKILNEEVVAVTATPNKTLRHEKLENLTKSHLDKLKGKESGRQIDEVNNSGNLKSSKRKRSFNSGDAQLVSKKKRCLENNELSNLNNMQPFVVLERCDTSNMSITRITKPTEKESESKENVRVSPKKIKSPYKKQRKATQTNANKRNLKTLKRNKNSENNNSNTDSENKENYKHGEEITLNSLNCLNNNPNLEVTNITSASVLSKVTLPETKGFKGFPREMKKIEVVEKQNNEFSLRDNESSLNNNDMPTITSLGEAKIREADNFKDCFEKIKVAEKENNEPALGHNISSENIELHKINALNNSLNTTSDSIHPICDEPIIAQINGKSNQKSDFTEKKLQVTEHAKETHVIKLLGNNDTKLQNKINIHSVIKIPANKHFQKDSIGLEQENEFETLPKTTSALTKQFEFTESEATKTPNLYKIPQVASNSLKVPVTPTSKGKHSTNTYWSERKRSFDSFIQTIEAMIANDTATSTKRHTRNYRSREKYSKPTPYHAIKAKTSRKSTYYKKLNSSGPTRLITIDLTKESEELDLNKKLLPNVENSVSANGNLEEYCEPRSIYEKKVEFLGNSKNAAFEVLHRGILEVKSICQRMDERLIKIEKKFDKF